MVADIFNSHYANRARRLIDLASSLRGIGPDSLCIPQIVVIGGQSSGKSSLVEAVTNIRVPRDSGTCTRCPMECHMKRDAGPWSCQISLRFRYDAMGGELSEPSAVPFGPTLSSPNGVELVLRRAQTAILNPHESPTKFLSKSEKDLQYYKTEEAYNNGTLKFSKNAVCIEIRDPDAVNLSFVDLPGLISNEEQSCIALVEDLVRSRIEQQCLILVTIPMSDDMENQRAMRIAKEVDRTGVRTIAVLTKPDSLTAGSTSQFEKWKSIMSGENLTHALRLGYYCVKLPDDAQRTADMMSPPSRAVRQAREMQFFQSTQPWSNLQNKSRFGVGRLLDELSKNLTTMLDAALPGLRSDTQSQLEECRSEFSGLPTAFNGDAIVEVLGRITSFCQELHEIVYGFSNDKSFIRANRETYKIFKKSIRKTTPEFQPWLAGGDDSESFGPDFDTTTVGHNEDGQRGMAGGTEPRELEYVREVIKKSISWELPHNVPFDAKRRLICEYTALWDKPAFNCYEEIARRLEDLLEGLIEKHFSRYKALWLHAGVLVNEQLDVQKGLAVAAVNAALALEKNPVFTQNFEYLEVLRNQWLATYRSSKRVPSGGPPREETNSSNGDNRSASPASTLYDGSWGRPAPEPTPVDRVLNIIGNIGKSTSPFEIAKLTLQELGLNHLANAATEGSLDDGYEEEIVVMADVRAYFEVAYKRVIDHIPLTIEHALNQGFASSIKLALLQKLDVCSPNAGARLKEFVTEDPAVSENRDKLKTRMSMLEKMHAELRGFGV